MANLLENCKRLDYSPDQPREENGQFGEVGSGGSGKSIGKAARTVSWKAGDGRDLRAEISVEKGLVDRTASADGDTMKVGVDLHEKTTIKVFLAGKEVATHNGEILDPPSAQGLKAGAVGQIGQVGIKQPVADQLKAAIREAHESIETAEIREYRSARDSRARAVADVDRSYSLVSNAMTLKNKTY